MNRMPATNEKRAAVEAIQRDLESSRGSRIWKDYVNALRLVSQVVFTRSSGFLLEFVQNAEDAGNGQVGKGEVNVFVPKHLRTVVDGTVLFGTSTFHDGEGGWKKFMRKFRYGSDARTNGPTLAFQDTSGEVRLRIRMNGLLGLVRIYRLAHEVQLVRPGMVAVGV